MNVLVSYAVSKSVMPVFLRSQFVQNRWPVVGQFDRVMITDGYEPTQFKRVICPRFGDGPDVFCLAAAHNTAMEYAMETGADWIIMLDADAVLTEVKEFPVNGNGFCDAYATVEGEFSPSSDHPERWRPTSYWVLHKTIFSKFRFCEKFKGYGWEDYDFVENVLVRGGIMRTQSLIKTMHLWHPVRAHKPKTFLANKALFESRRAK